MFKQLSVMTYWCSLHVALFIWHFGSASGHGCTAEGAKGTQTQTAGLYVTAVALPCGTLRQYWPYHLCFPHGRPAGAWAEASFVAGYSDVCKSLASRISLCILCYVLCLPSLFLLHSYCHSLLGQAVVIPQTVSPW